MCDDVQTMNERLRQDNCVYELNEPVEITMQAGRQAPGKGTIKGRSTNELYLGQLETCGIPGLAAVALGTACSAAFDHNLLITWIRPRLGACWRTERTRLHRVLECYQSVGCFFFDANNNTSHILHKVVRSMLVVCFGITSLWDSSLLRELLIIQLNG